MKKHDFDNDRRRFFKLGLLAGASWAVLPALRISAVFAQEKPKVVQPDDPAAKALGYVTDATKVDKAKWPKYEKGQRCDNCMFYSEQNKKQGKCQIFAGNLVQATGWCNSWAKKSG